MNSNIKKLKVKKLFEFVEQNKQSKPLVAIFEEYANMVGQSANSVRNFYYASLKQALNSPNQIDGINLSLHKKNVAKKFSAKESEILNLKINNLIKQGKSVRGACLDLANGDANVMIRLQNKFRSSNKKVDKTTQKNNVLQMPSRNTLSDSDVNSLFLGLVRLVQSQAEKKALYKFESQNAMLKQHLRKSILDFNKKNSELELLRESFKQVNIQNDVLKNRIECLQMENVVFAKNEKLKKFINKLPSNKNSLSTI